MNKFPKIHKCISVLKGSVFIIHIHFKPLYTSHYTHLTHIIQQLNLQVYKVYISDYTLIKPLQVYKSGLLDICTKIRRENA